MKNKMNKLLLGTILLSVLVFSGIAFAYMFRKTDLVKNEFVKSEVSCKVFEITDLGNASEGLQIANQKTSIKVQNTGTIHAYLRVRLVTNWVKRNTETNEFEITAKPSPDFSIELGENWIAGSNHMYYYKIPIEPNGYTGDLLNSPFILKSEDGCYQVVEVFAEAIQSQPVKTVMESWEVTLDSQGHISNAN